MLDSGETPLVEPVTELPATPAAQIEEINLFPNQAEITAGTGFSDHRFGYVLHGETRATYESNLFIRPRDEQEDFIFQIRPGVAVGVGEFKSEMYGIDTFRHRFDTFSGKDYLYADYSPSYTWYTNHGELDTFDHAVRVAGEWTVQRFTAGLRAAYVTATLPVEDIGDRVSQERLTAALTTRYEYSGKTSIEVNAFYEGLEYDQVGVGSSEWRNEDWLNYQILPKIRLGLGATFATVERESEPSQTYEQARLRVIYEASDKFQIGLVGGMEWRQAEGSDDRSDGTFELDAAWSPFDGTYLYVRGYRQSVTGNTFGSDYNTATGAFAQYRQRLFRRFAFGLTAGFENAEYQDPAGTANFGRSDDRFFIRPGIGVDLASWMNCEVSGEFRQNESSDAERSFEAATATVRFRLLF